MSTAQFAMVEELASLIKDNLSCKHLVLSIEEALINFLQNDTSPDGVLELEPMSSYHRLLLHRLADIYGFSHESVGEGDERHLILERCPESSIPSVLVSDILWQYDESQSPITSNQLLRKKDALADSKMKQVSYPPSMSFEEREAAYLAARERIFSLGDGEIKAPVTPKQRNIPVVARRMIAHALGQRICDSSHNDKLSPPNVAGSNYVLDIAEKNKDQVNVVKASQDSILSSGQNSNEHGRKVQSKRNGNGAVNVRLNSETVMQNRAFCNGSGSSDLLHTGSNNRVGSKDNLEREHFGAAKRMFAHALGLPSAKENPCFLFKCNEAKKAAENKY